MNERPWTGQDFPDHRPDVTKVHFRCHPTSPLKFSTGVPLRPSPVPLRSRGLRAINNEEIQPSQDWLRRGMNHNMALTKAFLYTMSSPPFFLRDSRTGETRVRVKITPHEKATLHVWGDFHARSRFARSTIPEENRGLPEV